MYKPSLNKLASLAWLEALAGWQHVLAITAEYDQHSWVKPLLYRRLSLSLRPWKIVTRK